MRPIPATVLLAAGTEVDPDQRILKMLARASHCRGTADDRLLVGNSPV
jgi:hypothetical protein